MAIEFALKEMSLRDFLTKLGLQVEIKSEFPLTHRGNSSRYIASIRAEIVSGGMLTGCVDWGATPEEAVTGLAHRISSETLRLSDDREFVAPPITFDGSLD